MSSHLQCSTEVLACTSTFAVSVNEIYQFASSPQINVVYRDEVVIARFQHYWGGGGWGKGVPYSSDAISYCFKIACQRMFQLSDPGVDCSLQWTTFSFAYDTCR